MDNRKDKEGKPLPDHVRLNKEEKLGMDVWYTQHVAFRTDVGIFFATIKAVLKRDGISVDHDCVIGDYVHIAAGAHLAGTVTVCDMTWIGAGATVSNNLSIRRKQEGCKTFT